jgi:hypothetical protein
VVSGVRAEELDKSIVVDPSATLFAVPYSIPKASSDGRIHLTEENATVVFAPSASKGSIQQYEIDTNLSQDSDGDGKKDNDVDNRTHPSYRTGESFSYTYTYTRDPIYARLTVVGNNGVRHSTDRVILFDMPVESDAQHSTTYYSMKRTVPLDPGERTEKVERMQSAVQNTEMAENRKQFIQAKLVQLNTEEVTPEERRIIVDEIEEQIDSLLLKPA